MNYKEKLTEFHNAVLEKTKDLRSAPDQLFLGFDEVAELRYNLIAEESEELLTALTIGTRDEVRKELCDLLYVVFGTAVVFGFDVDSDFEVVHQNNLLKVQTGSVREDGKLVKDKDHPKVIF